LAYLNGARGHQENINHNKIWAFLLDNNAIWLEECFEHFHLNNDRGLSRMDVIVLENLCG